MSKLRCKLQRGCYTKATCLATLRKVEDSSTSFATRNATIAVAKWGVTRQIFLATCNATFVALQVARKIASCNMTLSPPVIYPCYCKKQIAVSFSCVCPVIDHEFRHYIVKEVNLLISFPSLDGGNSMEMPV